MDQVGNIVIGDSSAEFFLLHSDAASHIAGNLAWKSPLDECAQGAKALSAFNSRHRLYGGQPVTLLVPEKSYRRVNDEIACTLASGKLPARSFFELRNHLYMATPELVFLRAACHLPLGALVALGVNLCARYYVRLPEDEITKRASFLTTPDKLRDYIEQADFSRGREKAKKALPYIVTNSGSPEETRSWVQFTLPVRYGGFGLKFTHMNYPVNPERLANMVDKGWYELDMVSKELKFALEYDGAESHLDPGADKRRRNDLKVLGWDVYPIDSSVLYNPEKTKSTAEQLAKLMGTRIRYGKGWADAYAELRQSIGLPV